MGSRLILALIDFTSDWMAIRVNKFDKRFGSCRDSGGHRKSRKGATTTCSENEEASPLLRHAVPVGAKDSSLDLVAMEVLLSQHKTDEKECTYPSDRKQ